MKNSVQTQKTIFLIEEDDDVRPILKQNLIQAGYRVIVVIDEAGAVECIQNRQNSFDLILLNQVTLSSDEIIDMGGRIRDGANYSEVVPIVVMAEKYGAELEGQTVAMGQNKYITYLEDGQQLLDLLRILLEPAA